MPDYEELILARQDDEETDDCFHCKYAGDKCHGECMQIIEGRKLEEIYPNLFK